MPLVRNVNNMYLVHGFNVDDEGASTVDVFKPYITTAKVDMLDFDKGVTTNVIDFEYGWTGLHNIIKVNKRTSESLAKQVNRNISKHLAQPVHASIKLNNDQSWQTYPTGQIYSTAIAHSNGCAVVCEAAQLGAKFRRVLLINPALPVDYKFSDNIGEVMVVHTAHDKVTKAARLAKKIPFLRWFVPPAWGAMGTYGSIGDNRTNRVFNYDLTKYLDGHSALFEHDIIQVWGRFLVEHLTNTYSYYDRTRRLTAMKELVDHNNNMEAYVDYTLKGSKSEDVEPENNRESDEGDPAIGRRSTDQKYEEGEEDRYIESEPSTSTNEGDTV